MKFIRKCMLDRMESLLSSHSPLHIWKKLRTPQFQFCMDCKVLVKNGSPKHPSSPIPKSSKFRSFGLKTQWIENSTMMWSSLLWDTAVRWAGQQERLGGSTNWETPHYHPARCWAVCATTTQPFMVPPCLANCCIPWGHSAKGSSSFIFENFISWQFEYCLL
jgi:hypothetical protein